MIKFEFLKKLAVLISILSTVSSAYAAKNTCSKWNKMPSAVITVNKRCIDGNFLSNLFFFLGPINTLLGSLRKYSKVSGTELEKKVDRSDHEELDGPSWEDLLAMGVIIDGYSEEEKERYLVAKDSDGIIYSVRYKEKTYNIKV